MHSYFPGFPVSVGTMGTFHLEKPLMVRQFDFRPAQVIHSQSYSTNSINVHFKHYVSVNWHLLTSPKNPLQTNNFRVYRSVSSLLHIKQLHYNMKVGQHDLLNNLVLGCKRKCLFIIGKNNN